MCLRFSSWTPSIDTCPEVLNRQKEIETLTASLHQQMAIREQEKEQERIAKATRALKSFLNQKLRGKSLENVIKLRKYIL